MVTNLQNHKIFYECAISANVLIYSNTTWSSGKPVLNIWFRKDNERFLAVRQEEFGVEKVHTRARARTSVYPKVSGLAAWSENCKWYSFLPLGAVVSLFCESVY
jgi:hypothetical protein